MVILNESGQLRAAKAFQLSMKKAAAERAQKQRQSSRKRKAGTSATAQAQRLRVRVQALTQENEQLKQLLTEAQAQIEALERCERSVQGERSALVRTVEQAQKQAAIERDYPRPECPAE